MKVELLQTLKYGSDKYWSKGWIFEPPLPPEINQEVKLNRGIVRVIEDSAPIEVSNPELEKPKEPKRIIVRKKDD